MNDDDGGATPSDPPRTLPPEIGSFLQVLEGRRTPATWCLLATIVAVFGLEMALGARDEAVVMVAMGALNRERVLAGEVWRLVSATLLHGDIVHLLFNGWVLWSLGTTLERLIGTPRFLVLYVLSALGGSVVSLMFLEGLSVGASGALWGVMTAEFLLGRRDDGFLPAPVRASLTRGAGQNLVINVVASMRPGVDWAAHLGGGVVGGVVVALGLLAVGLPRWNGTTRSPDRVPGAIRGLAYGGVGLLAVGMITALVAGRPWDLGAPPRLAPVEVAGGWTLDLPAGLGPTEAAGTDGEEVWGDLALDGMVVIVVVTPLSAEERALPVAVLEDALAQELDRAPAEGGPAPTVTRADGGVILTTRTLDNGIHLRRAVAIREGAVLSVDTGYMPSRAPGWEDVADRAVASARLTPGPATPR